MDILWHVIANFKRPVANKKTRWIHPAGPEQNVPVFFWKLVERTSKQIGFPGNGGTP